jgi:hypothetical protein
MSALSTDEFGFVQAHKYGRVPPEEIEKLLGGLQSNEQIYRSTIENGARVARPLDDTADVNAKPGDTFSAGPRIIKASTLPDLLSREASALQRAGFSVVGKPEMYSYGWRIHMRGLPLPRGIRTEALILLPKTYPETSPIGFYLKDGAKTGGLDTSHLYRQSYHGALDLSKEGWLWFCGVPDNWVPGRHHLITYVSIVLSFLNENN